MANERGRVLYFQGGGLQRTGKDPVALFNQAIADAEQTWLPNSQATSSPGIYWAMPILSRIYDSNHKSDPTSSWKLAKTYFSKATAPFKVSHGPSMIFAVGKYFTQIIYDWEATSKLYKRQKVEQFQK